MISNAIVRVLTHPVVTIPVAFSILFVSWLVAARRSR